MFHSIIHCIYFVINKFVRLIYFFLVISITFKFTHFLIANQTTIDFVLVKFYVILLDY